MLVFCKGPNILKNFNAKKLMPVKLSYLEHLVELSNLLWSAQHNDLAFGLQFQVCLRATLRSLEVRPRHN